MVVTPESAIQESDRTVEGASRCPPLGMQHKGDAWRAKLVENLQVSVVKSTNDWVKSVEIVQFMIAEGSRERAAEEGVFSRCLFRTRTLFGGNALEDNPWCDQRERSGGVAPGCAPCADDKIKATITNPASKRIEEMEAHPLMAESKIKRCKALFDKPLGDDIEVVVIPTPDCEEGHGIQISTSFLSVTSGESAIPNVC